MEFTVYTSAGGFREFVGNSEYHVGEQNGCLYVVDGKTDQVITYGATAWASVQEWQRDEGAGAKPAADTTGGRRRVGETPATTPDVAEVHEADDVDVVEPASVEPAEPAQPGPVPVDLPPLPRPQHAAMADGAAPPRQFDPLSDPLETFAD